MSKTCVICGRSFEMKEGEKKFNFERKVTCSRECRYRHSMNQKANKLRADREALSRTRGEIPLSKGGYAYVDPEDHDMVMDYSWYEEESDYTSYAVSTTIRDGKRVRVSLHRLLTGAPDGVDVDHVDGDGLNNRRSNIRVATRSQNVAHRLRGSRPKSGYRGVYQNGNGDKKWRAVSGGVTIGSFSTPAEAAVAYDQYVTERHGEFAVTNRQILSELLHEYEATCDEVSDHE